MTTIDVSPQSLCASPHGRISASGEPRLQQAQRLMQVGCLAGNIAHDLNNLLMVIEGSAGLAAESLPDGHVAQHDMDVIILASRRSSAMLRQILGFARQQPSVPLPIHVGHVIDGIDLLIGRVTGVSITTNIKVAPGLWLTIAIPSQIEQILLNLMTNARDAMPHGGRLTVSVRNHTEASSNGMSPREYVLIEVTDTGVGIGPEVRQQLTAPFYTTKEPGKGVGLGLTICASIVAQLGGKIELESEVGVGTTFQVLLPRALV